MGNTADHFVGMLEIMDVDYMKARVADVRDVSERLIAVLMGNNSEKLFKTLSGENEDLSGGDEAEIIVAEDLSPSETVQMDKSRVRSFVTRLGSANSHTAILARTMNISALIGIDYEEDIDGKTAVVDGFQGTLIVDPDSETLLKYVKKEEEERSKQELLLTLKGKETVTKSGKAIQRYANIGGLSDLQYVRRMTQPESDCSAVSFFIWKSRIIQAKKNSFRYINRSTDDGG